jgi:mannitol/fructose-specific phosphotransferase system IIA component (Ntr-type)
MAGVLADLLDERHVTLELRARSRNEALREIIATLQGDEKLSDAEKFLREVRALEEVHTTFVGDGVAFPHTRTDLVTQIVVGIGRSAEGIPFGEKGEPAHLIFVIGVPRRLVNEYLVCVGMLARLTKDETTRAALMNAKTPLEFVELLREGSLLLE